MTDLILAALLAVLPPCPVEDADWCGWNAAEQGNGEGRSFASLGPVFIIAKEGQR